ncbi:MAG TPA: hypothetical protein PLA14_11695 [Ferruginibacter sp.]|nr:hypothetical protein [Ferruginibacter sp.]
MIDTVQLILLLVIVVLAVLLVVLGIQVFYILKDLRNTLSKANRVLDNAGSISELEEKITAIVATKKIQPKMGVHSLEKIKNWSLQNAAIAIEKAVTGF